MQPQPSADIAIHEAGDVYVVNLHPSQRNAGSHSKNLRASTEQNRKERPTTDESGLATTDIIKLFQRIRDESHRFAVSYHTALKRQQQTKNQLEEIPGIGPKTRRKLIRKFGSVTGVSRASLQELSMAIGEQKAKTVIAFLKDILKA